MLAARLTVVMNSCTNRPMADQKEGAAAHGLQRWQQGYNQRETARDWGHLQMCLLVELESFEATFAVSSRTAMQIALTGNEKLMSFSAQMSDDISGLTFLYISLFQ